MAELRGLPTRSLRATSTRFFVAGPYAWRGVGRALMAQIHRAAQQAGMARPWADVSLSADAFFSRSGFAVEARQQVAAPDVAQANARMAKVLY